MIFSHVNMIALCPLHPPPRHFHVLVYTLFLQQNTRNIHVLSMIYYNRISEEEAPASGAAAATPKGVALAHSSALTPTSLWWALVTLYPTSPRWYGARRGEPTTAIHAINSCRENYVRMAFEHSICTLLTSRSLAWPIRYVLTRLNTPWMPIFLGRRIRMDRRWVKGVGAGN
jgi:hypothetical protein